MAEDWYPCDLCGARYRSRRAALRCCGDRFDDDPLGPVTVPDGHGAPMRTDGGDPEQREEHRSAQQRANRSVAGRDPDEWPSPTSRATTLADNVRHLAATVDVSRARGWPDE